MRQKIEQAVLLRSEFAEEINEPQPAVEEKDHGSDARCQNVVEELQRERLDQANERQRQRHVFDEEGGAPICAASYKECGQKIYQKRISELHSREDRVLRRQVLAVSERSYHAEMKRQVA